MPTADHEAIHSADSQKVLTVVLLATFLSHRPSPFLLVFRLIGALAPRSVSAHSRALPTAACAAFVLAILRELPATFTNRFELRPPRADVAEILPSMTMLHAFSHVAHRLFDVLK